MIEQFEVPILFLAFNRPDTMREVLLAIKKVSPKKIFIAIDGARSNKPNEAIIVKEVKQIINEIIDWPCEKQFLYRDKNLGCKLAVSSAISWFFENVEEGIILEDDCVPDISFFSYCQELLRYYRDNKDVMMVSGDNFQDGKTRGNGSYYLSKYVHIWGWATWRRAWNFYDIEMKTFQEFLTSNKIRGVFEDKEMQEYWLKNFKLVYDNKIDTWDFQWIYTIWEHDGLAIIPNVNLVSNIGFRNDATHTKTIHNKLQNKTRESVGIIKHPSPLVVDREADKYYYYHVFKRNFWRKLLDKMLYIVKTKLSL